MPKMYNIIKRISDITLSIIFGVLLSPLLLMCIILIKIGSNGSAIYKQKRIGRKGKEFTLYKLRTMYKHNENNQPIWVPRKAEITRIGRILRNLMLDELPQLINIIKGDMSFIGPRPERPFFAKNFMKKYKNYHERLKVRSGLTGWAQTNGYYGDTSIKKRLEYDLFYIENISFLFDIKIIWLTLVMFLEKFF